MKSQNDIAWEAFFEKYQVLARIEKEGVFIANASQMKAYREPRLMAKFDHHINLPKIFTQNHLAILPVSRGDYIIAPFQAYHAFEPAEQTITHVSLPSHLQSLRINDISSETIAINCALASGILSDFLEEDILYAAVSGRMGSGQFDFQIQDSQFRSFIPVSVNNSQIEIDAAFEGTRSLSLIEAKRDLSEDFLIRQLYYPFRLWHSRITKQVKPVFLVYSNGIFHLYEYTFQNMERYNSLLLIKHKNYTIEDTAIEFSDLLEIAKGVQPVLSNILIETISNDRVRFLATDLNLSISIKLKAEVVSEGRITLSAKTLEEITNKLPDKPIVLKLNEETNVVTISCGKTKFELIGISAEEYPKVFDDNQTAEGDKEF